MNTWTKDKVASRLRDIKQKNGRVNYSTVYKLDTPLRGAINNLFNSFDEALEYAGLDPSKERVIKKTVHSNFISNSEKEIIDGLVISDGYLEQGKKSINAKMRFRFKWRGFCDTIMDFLPSFHWHLSESNYFDKRTNKTYYGWRLESRCHPYLTKQRERWYKNGIKIIPPDFKLTQKSLLWWYLGDGCLNRKACRPDYRRILLCTQSFSLDELKILVKKLIKFLRNSNIYIENKEEICIARSAVSSFYQIIGDKSPVLEYQYKFDFGHYKDPNYFKKSYETRPLAKINALRKERAKKSNLNKNTVLVSKGDEN